MNSSELDLPGSPVAPATESLFERCHWLYAFCREYLFRDHTPEIARALFPTAPPSAGARLLELGCGPGLYACRFAQKYPQIATTGFDLSRPLIKRATSRAHHLDLQNCNFQEGDAQALPLPSASVNAVIVSRLFLIVPNKEAVLHEIFRVLRPGGRCFIAEPTSSFTTRLPLIAMWLVAKLSRTPMSQYREPQQVDIMSSKDFVALIHAQDWISVEIGGDDWYQYAVCEKGNEADAPLESAA